MLLFLLVLLLDSFGVLETALGSSLHILVTVESKDLVEGLPGFFKFVDGVIRSSHTIECLTVFSIFIEGLTRVLDRKVVILQFVIAVGQVGAYNDLDILDVLDCLILGRDHCVFFHLEEHFQSKK